MTETYIVTAVRTAIGKFGGTLKDVAPVDLAAHVMGAALNRAQVAGSDLDLYIMGHIYKHGQGQLVPRHAAIKAGIPSEVDGYALDMLCSSGMMAMMNGDMAIRAGDAELVLAGGVESMSQTGFYLSHKARWGYKFMVGNQEPLLDVLTHDGLTDPLTGELMGEETERLAREHGVSRAELDEVAFLSHERAAAARENGRFAHEIVPFPVAQRRGEMLFDADEGIRPATTMDSLAGLRPAFRPDGLLTAGNASQMSDGACAVLLAGKTAVEKYDLKPVARIVGHAWAAVESWRFVEAIVPATQKLMAKTGWSTADFELVENNEAFALNNILLRKYLEIPYERINVHGGAIALGHPLGCSGARIVTTLIHALQQNGKERGLATLCHGVGGGTALAVELVP